MNRTTTLYCYDFRPEKKGVKIGEKLARSHAHAEAMRQRYERKYGCTVNAIFFKKIVKKNGRVIHGF